jgi:anti-sigma factor RsiW
MDLSQLAELPSADAREIKRWLESYVDYAVDVPTIRDATLSGGHVLRSGRVNAVAVTYVLRGRPLMYVVMPTAYVMGRHLDEERVDTISLEGFNAVTWVEMGTARVLLAPMAEPDIAAVAEQCRKRGATP